MTTKEMIEVITAFENGQEIEAQRKCSDNSANWFDATSPSWDFYTCNFRIKQKQVVSSRLLTIREVWGKTLVNDHGDMFIVAHSSSGHLTKVNDWCSIGVLHHAGWKLAGPDLNYKTAISLEVQTT